MDQASQQTSDQQSQTTGRNASHSASHNASHSASQDGSQAGSSSSQNSGFAAFKDMFTSASGAKGSPLAAVRTTRLAEELALLVREYLKQQTVRPLRDLLRWLVLGLLGAVLILVGLAMLALAGLRALQAQTGSTFTGSLSWLPYLITVGGLMLVMLVVFLAMIRPPTGLPKNSNSGSSKKSKQTKQEQTR